MLPKIDSIHYSIQNHFKINSQSLEDTQVGYISQKYSFDKYSLGRAFKPSYALFTHLSLHIHFRAFKPSYTYLWVGRVLPETKLKNKWTLFFELFDLSNHYIFEHLSLHIHFCGWGGSSEKQNSKINGLCFLNFLN